MAYNTAMPSGYDYEFVQEVPDDYICSICHFVMRKPVQTKCGHQFCKECLEEANKRNPQCPEDREPLTSQEIFEDKVMGRRIMSLVIKCSKQACIWQGELKDIEEHTSECPQYPISCPNNCGEMNSRHQVFLDKMESKTTVRGPEEAFILSTMHALWKNRCLSIIVGLKIPELLCAAEDSLSIEDIAKTSGCTSSKGLYPVMKVLAQWGIGKELENKYFAKNRGMQLLRRDNGPGLGHLIEYVCGDEAFSAMRLLPACVKHDQPAFASEHGMDNYGYMNDIKDHPYDKTKMFEGSSVHPIGSDDRRREFAENYNESMAYSTRITTLPDVEGLNNVFEAFPWSTCKNLLDMGGCSGYFLAQILKLPGCEHIQGYVIDLPKVVDDAQKTLESLGIPGHRIEFIKHDFTQSFPSDLQLQVDTILFKYVIGMIIHDHELVAKILLNCRSLFPSQGGRLLIIEYSLKDAGDTDNIVSGINGLELEALSLHWLNMTGHYLPSRSEWIKSLQEIGIKTGYRLKQIYDTFPGGKTIFELSCNTIQ